MNEFNAVQVLDRFSLVTPLGIRFWDAVTNRIVADEGLRITVYPEANPTLKTQGFSNSQGVYVFRNLPGLRAIENGIGEHTTTFWNDPKTQVKYVLEVFDSVQRFLPVRMPMTLPRKGLFTLDCPTIVSPLTLSGFIPLFSAPARTVAGGLAVLRAELWDTTANTAAAWVVMDVRIPGKPPFQGMSDGQGHIALFFPYPEPTDFAPDNTFVPPADPAHPPPLQGSPLKDHQWTVEIHAYYQPAKQEPPQPATPPLIATLCSILSQKEATLLADLNPQKTLTQGSLKYGQELVLRSTDSSQSKENQPSVLAIIPAA